MLQFQFTEAAGTMVDARPEQSPALAPIVESSARRATR